MNGLEDAILGVISIIVDYFNLLPEMGCNQTTIEILCFMLNLESRCALSQQSSDIKKLWVDCVT